MNKDIHPDLGTWIIPDQIPKGKHPLGSGKKLLVMQ